MKTLEERDRLKSLAKESAELQRERFEHVINVIMASSEGREFVRWVLSLLRYGEKNTPNSAEAYRIAAVQNVALDVYQTVYDIDPAQCERMMREKVE